MKFTNALLKYGLGVADSMEHVPFIQVLDLTRSMGKLRLQVNDMVLLTPFQTVTRYAVLTCQFI